MSRKLVPPGPAPGPTQRAAVAVETASFYPQGKPKENYKVERSTVNDIADSQGIGRNLIVWAKAVWDAAEDAGDHCLHVAITPANPP